MIAVDEGGPIRGLCCHLRWEKISLAVSSNRVHISVNRSRCSTRCRDDHKLSILVHRFVYMIHPHHQKIEKDRNTITCVCMYVPAKKTLNRELVFETPKLRCLDGHPWNPTAAHLQAPFPNTEPKTSSLASEKENRSRFASCALLLFSPAASLAGLPSPASSYSNASSRRPTTRAALSSYPT